MKKLILAMAMTMFMAATASAGTVKLAWDAVPDADGYKVYLDGQVSAQATTNSAEVVVETGKHSFYVTAYNTWGESAPSNIVTTPNVAGVPAGLRVVITIDVTPPTSK